MLGLSCRLFILYSISMSTMHEWIYKPTISKRKLHEMRSLKLLYLFDIK